MPRKVIRFACDVCSREYGKEALAVVRFLRDAFAYMKWCANWGRG